MSGQAWLVRLHAKDSGIPYGIALAIGALMIYPETEWVQAVDRARFRAGPPVERPCLAAGSLASPADRKSPDTPGVKTI